MAVVVVVVVAVVDSLFDNFAGVGDLRNVVCLIAMVCCIDSELVFGVMGCFG